MTPLELTGLVLLSGITAVDAAAAFQVMISQPIVCGWAAGCLVGQPATGLWIGLALQLLWSRLAPVGATAYPDVGPATVAGVLVTGSLLSRRPPWHPDSAGFIPPPEYSIAILAGLLVALVLGRFGQFLTVAERKGNARLAEAADRAAANGSFAGVERANFTGVARSFLRGVFVFVPALVISLAVGSGGTSFLAELPPDVSGVTGLTAFWWFGFAALGTVLFRGGRMDWLILAAGLLLGGVVRGVFF